MTDKEKFEKLLDARDVLKGALFRNKSVLQAVDSNVRVDLHQFISFADFITDTLSAPKGWQEGYPLVASHPPAPLPDQMRRGKLGELEHGMSMAPEESTEIGAAGSAGQDSATNEAKSHVLTAVPVPVKKEVPKVAAKAAAVAARPEKTAIDFGMDSDSD